MNNGRQEQAKVYNRLKRRLGLIEIALDLGFLIVVLLTGFSQDLRTFLSLAGAELAGPYSELVVIAGYVIVLGGLIELISFPLNYYSGYRLEHRFQLSNQTFGSWLLDHLKGVGVGLLLGLPLVELLYFFLRHFPENWWLIAGVVFTLIVVVLARLAPVLLMPIFYKFKPLEDEDLRHRLAVLAEKAGTRVEGIYELNLSEKTKTANAALMGLGRTRRILLSDTLLKEYEKDEVEVVLAHELAHQVYGHIWKGMAVQTVLTFVGFYLADVILRWGIARFNFRGTADIAAFPLFILVLLFLSLLTMPLVNTFSRRLEYQADEYALQATQKPAYFISAMRKLAAQNLAEAEPPPLIEFIFYSHPSIARRIHQAQQKFPVPGS